MSVEIKQDTIYTGNHVSEELVNAVKELLEKYDEIDVSFDVIGRTMHGILAHQLHHQLGTSTYGARIEYNYGCRIFKNK